MREQLLRFGRCIVSVWRHCIQGPFQLANMFRYFVYSKGTRKSDAVAKLMCIISCVLDNPSKTIVFVVKLVYTYLLEDVYDTML